MKKIILIFVLSLLLAGCSYQTDQQLQTENKALREKVARLERAKTVTQEVVESKVILREDFRKAIMGKTPQEVIQAVGKPQSTQDFGKDFNFWYYDGRTKDPITGKVDGRAQVCFKNGVADHVNF